MPFTVSPQKQPIVDLPEILDIPRPPNLAFLLYGFSSTRFALELLHPQPITPSYESRLKDLVSNTDTDLVICPRTNNLSVLHEEGALAYYLQIEKKLKGQIETVPTGSTPPSFLHYTFEGRDYSIQTRQIDAHLHTSYQVFYDLHQKAFLFKNESCYERFMIREIHTPDLNSIMTAAKTNRVLYQTLIFILRSHLKMRALGWVLSTEDRALVKELLQDKEFTKKINQSLQEKFIKKPYAQGYIHELQKEVISLDLLNMDRPDELIKIILHYKPTNPKDEIVGDIHWLLSHPILTPFTKEIEFQKYCNQLFTDPTKQDEDLKYIVSQTDESHLEKLEGHDEWKKYKQSLKPTMTTPPVSTKTRPRFQLKDFDTKEWFVRPSKRKNKIDDLLAEYPLKSWESKKDSDPFSAVPHEIYCKSRSEFRKHYNTSNKRVVPLLLVTMILTRLIFQIKWESEQPINLELAVCLGLTMSFLWFLDRQFWKQFHTNEMDLKTILLAEYSIRKINKELNSNKPTLSDDEVNFLCIATLTSLLGNSGAKSGKAILEDIESKCEHIEVTKRLLYLAEIFTITSRNQVENPTTAQILQFVQTISQYHKFANLKDFWLNGPQPELIGQEDESTLSPEQKSLQAQIFAESFLNLSKKPKPDLTAVKFALSELITALAKLSADQLKSMESREFQPILRWVTQQREKKDPATQFLLHYSPFSLLVQSPQVLTAWLSFLNDLPIEAAEEFTSKPLLFSPLIFEPTEGSQQKIMSRSIKLPDFKENKAIISDRATLDVMANYQNTLIYYASYLPPTFSFVMGTWKYCMIPPAPSQEILDKTRREVLSVHFFVTLAFYMTSVQLTQIFYLALNHRELYDKLIHHTLHEIKVLSKNATVNSEKIHDHAIYALSLMLLSGNKKQYPIALKNINLIYQFSQNFCGLKKTEFQPAELRSLFGQIAAYHHIPENEINQIWAKELPELEDLPSDLGSLHVALAKSESDLRNFSEQQESSNVPIKMTINHYARIYARIFQLDPESLPSTSALPSLEKFVREAVVRYKKNPGLLYLLHTDPLLLFTRNSKNRASLVNDLTEFAEQNSSPLSMTNSQFSSKL